MLIEAHRHFVATSVQSGVDVSRPEEGREKKAIKTLFYPALHFNNPFPSGRQKEKGGIYVHGGGEEWETQRAVIEMCGKLGEQENCG